MIKMENTSVHGWESAIRGMRNPMNSWEKCDTDFQYSVNLYTDNCMLYPNIGPNDLDLMKRLAKAGPEHAKYRRMITVYADITAPLYWYKEMDTYKVGTVCNSCSTMRKIHEKEFTLDDFSHEHLDDAISESCLYKAIETLNYLREVYKKTGNKDFWYSMIQLLPSSYNQRRTYMFNYEVLSNIYKQRRNHKLNEWVDFCKWIETLPYSEVITLK